LLNKLEKKKSISRMDEFELIETFFKSIINDRRDVILGIGDDAACISIPDGFDLLVSTDTLVLGRHFLPEWDGFDVAYKALMTNISDIAAMGGQPVWLSLSLTLPEINKPWLSRFTKGLYAGMQEYNLALIGGDTTKGPLSITITIQGLIPKGKCIKRAGAKPGDSIYISGPLGAAALAVKLLDKQGISEVLRQQLMHKLLHPKPRVDLAPVLQDHASAAIDISDGLSSDLNHICKASHVGACIHEVSIPVAREVKQYLGSKALELALHGGDDYELCFTVAPNHEQDMLKKLQSLGITCYRIGMIDSESGIRMKDATDKYSELAVSGYKHF
jgi:thiamine-monophosphate kinase